MSWAKGWMTNFGGIIVAVAGLAKMVFPGESAAVDAIAGGVEKVVEGGFDISNGIGLIGGAVAVFGFRRALGRMEK